MEVTPTTARSAGSMPVNIYKFKPPDRRQRVSSPTFEGNTHKSTPKSESVKASAWTSPALEIPQFVAQYYKTSTFHHLSTWRTQFQEMTSRLIEDTLLLDALPSQPSQSQSQSQQTHSQSQHPNLSIRKRVKSNGRRLVLHVDMDCFYVSVMLKELPHLRNKPVAVIPSNNINGTSEISSVSYEARPFGVKPRMLIKDAKALCPELQVVPCNFEKYYEVSSIFYKILVACSTDIEAVSADEAYIDVSWCEVEELPALISTLREDIYNATQCTASVGCGPNKLIARLATSRAKPNNYLIFMDKEAECKVSGGDSDGKSHFVVEDPQAFVLSFMLKDIPGIGDVTRNKLEEMGIQTTQQLSDMPLHLLSSHFAEKCALYLHNTMKGIDQRPLKLTHQRRSLSSQISWGVRFSTKEQVHKFILELSQEMEGRLKKAGENIKTNHVTLRLKKKKSGGKESRKFMNPGEVIVISKSTTLPEPTSSADIISEACIKLWETMNVGPEEIRGAGIQVHLQPKKCKDSSTTQSNLLTNYFEKTKEERLDPIQPTSTPPNTKSIISPNDTPKNTTNTKTPNKRKTPPTQPKQTNKRKKYSSEKPANQRTILQMFQKETE